MGRNRKLFGRGDNRFAWTNYSFDDDKWLITIPKSLAVEILKIKATRYNKYKMLILCAYLLNSMDQKTVFKDQMIKKSKSATGKKRQKLKRIIEFNYESKVININSGFLKKHFGNHYRSTILEPLIHANILDQDNKYSPRGKSLGYFFSFDFDYDEVIHFEVNISKHEQLLSNLNHDLGSRNFQIIAPVYRYIYNNINNFYIDEVSLKDENLELYENIEWNIKAINSEEKNFNFRWNRLYTDYTNLKSEARKYIKLIGSDEKLIEVDITSSYLCMLINYIERFELLVLGEDGNKMGYTSNHESYKRFKMDVLNGEFYEKLAIELFDGNRGRAKEFVFRVLFTPFWWERGKKKDISHTNEIGKYQILLGELIIKNYVSVGLFLKEKKKRDYLRMFSLELSMIESHFIFDSVAPKLKHLTPFITIHDAIIVPESKGNEVMNIIKESSIGFFGFELPLKIKTL